MAEVEVPTPIAEDWAVLQRIIDREKRRPVNSPVRQANEEQLGEAPAVYLAISPTDIPARTDVAGTGSGDVPGSAVCDVYKLVNGVDIHPVTGLTRTVYNMGSVAVPAGLPVLVFQDKYGSWYVPTVVSSGLTVQEVDGTPSYPGVGTLLFDQADGFVLTQPAGGQARIDLAAATFDHAGGVSLADQVLGSGVKTVDALRVSAGDMPGGNPDPLDPVLRKKVATHGGTGVAMLCLVDGDNDGPTEFCLGNHLRFVNGVPDATKLEQRHWVIYGTHGTTTVALDFNLYDGSSGSSYSGGGFFINTNSYSFLIDSTTEFCSMGWVMAGSGFKTRSFLSVKTGQTGTLADGSEVTGGIITRIGP